MKKTVEIFDAEDSIVIEDDYTNDTFEFFPEQKMFKVDVSLKDDYHHNESTIEYKISVDPIRLWMRTIELSHRSINGNDSSIKDGVVLESELRKNKFNGQERIDDLKREVEWKEIPVLSKPEVNLYILSKHPEIISREEYRKFLRRSLERLKLGVLKVEEAVENNSHGLEFHVSDYGKSIWFPDGETQKIDRDKYYELPEAKRGESAYGKKLKHVEKFNSSLFEEGSSRYVGIADFEFKDSTNLIEHLEALLNEKEAVSTKKEDDLPQSNKRNIGIGWFIYLLTIFFIFLKLTDNIDWNWFGVLSPILIWEGLGFVSGFLRELAR